MLLVITTASYAIRTLGQRVHKKVGNSANHWFAYGTGRQLLSEHKGTWSHYIWLNGAPIARIKDNQLLFIHSDHLGRPEGTGHQQRKSDSLARQQRRF